MSDPNSNTAPIENGGTSFRAEEPPPDPEDFTTKEEELKNKILLQKLYEQQKKHREFVYQMELEKKVKEELEEEQRIKELVANKAYYERRNASAKYRAMKTNERIKKMLDKVEDYMRKIQRVEKIDKIKQQAQKEFLEEIEKKKRKITKEQIENISKLNKKNEYLRCLNKQKIMERAQEEKEKKLKLEKARKANERAQKILECGYDMDKFEKMEEREKNENKNKNKNGNGFFAEEEEMNGDNLVNGGIMNMNNIDNDNNYNNNGKKKKNYVYKSEALELKAEEELRKILKSDPYNVSKLAKFQKKYKYFDVSSYIHTAKMKQITEAKKVRVKHENLNLFLFGNEQEKYDNNPYHSYLSSCKYNNSSYIQSFLLTAKNDTHVFTMVNEKDEYKRNGLMYLIIHNNINMIKLTLLSGVDLSASTDKFNRNIVHYCCYENTDKELLDIICHCIDFKNFEERARYVEKCLKLEKRRENMDEDSEEYRNKCIERIEEFDKEFEEKEKVEEKEIKDKNNLDNEDNDDDDDDVNKNKLPQIVDPYEDLVKVSIPIKKLVNSPDNNGNFPIHYLALSNDLEKTEVLVYFHADLRVRDKLGRKAINITTNEVLQQYLLKNERKNGKNNNIGKLNGNVNDNKNGNDGNIGNNVFNFQVDEMKGDTCANNENNIVDGKKTEILNKSHISNISKNTNISNISTNIAIREKLLDMDKIRYYSKEKINEFRYGVDNNTYLISSVLSNEYEIFKYLLTEKDAKVDFINSNGWSVITFIFNRKLWKYFSYLLGFEECDTIEQLLEALTSKSSFEKADILKPCGDYTILGQSIKVLDTLTNKGENLLSMSVEEIGNINLIKIMVILYENFIKFFGETQPKDKVFSKQYGKYDDRNLMSIVFGREYGKNKEPIIIKCVKTKNLDMLKYIMDELYRKEKIIDLDIYQGDLKGQNMLHHAVLMKNKEIIKYLIKFDSDKNQLRENKDNKNKKPSDYDRSKQFSKEMLTIFDASSSNDTSLLHSLIFDLGYFSINESKPLSLDTALHEAARSKSDKAALFLIKNGADSTLKNSRGQTPIELAEFLKSRIVLDVRATTETEKWVKILKKIINGKIKEYTDLDKEKVNGIKEGKVKEVKKKDVKKRI